MATECKFVCPTIGTRATNAELIAKLSSKWVKAGSRVCEQLAEMSGCLVPVSRVGFVQIGAFGPRGPAFARTNPPNPNNIVCSNGRKAAKLCDVDCSPAT